MKDFNKIVFTPQTLVLIVSLAVNNVIVIQSIKSDIRNVLTEKKYEIQLLQYQIDELKNKKESKQIAFNEHHAILPNQTEIKDDE